MRYRHSSGIHGQTVGEERMLFDDAADAVHVLNGTAAFIWDCLRKPASAHGIEVRLHEVYDLHDVPDVSDMIARTLADFLDRGIIEPVPDEGHP